MTITRPVLRYFGGKWKLAPWIISNMPKHQVYVEPCGGAASVLMRKDPAPKLEVYNEILAEVTNVFKVLRSPKMAEQLERVCNLTPWSYEAFVDSWINDNSDAIEWARRILVRSFFSYSPLSSGRCPGFRMDKTDYTSGNHRNCAKDWLNHHDQIKIFTKRLKSVMILSKPALEIINQFNGKDVLIYIDPPYSMHKRRSQARYYYEWEEDDHLELVELILRSESMIMLSGYACPFYDKLLNSDWIQLSTKGWTQGLSRSEEFLWINPAAQVAKPQPELSL